jgi:hypothetical protein
MKKTIFSIFSGLLLPLLLTCGLAAETSTPQLQKLKHTVVSPSSEQVVLQLNGSYSPKAFTLKDEMPRIIFDFPDMTYGREVKGVTTTNGTIVKRIRVGMHTQDTPKTRIVFDVATLNGVTYTQHFDESTATLTVQFNTTAKIAAKAAPAVNKKPAMETEPAEKSLPLKKSEASVQAEPEPTSEGPIKATKETDPGPDPAKPLAEAKETAPPRVMAAGEKVGEKKTPPVTPEAPKPAPPDETKAAVKSEAAPAQPDPTTQPSVKEPSPQPVIAADASGDKQPPPPAQPQPSPTIEAKTAVKPEPAPTSEDAKIKPTAKEPAPQPPGATAKSDEKTSPANAQPPEAAATKPSAKAEAAKPAALSSAAAGALLESVKFDGSSPKGEMVLFKLNDFHPPVIHGVEEGVPRVICDFNNTQLVDLGKNLIKTNGKFVKLIRITRNKKPDRVRVVLDLEPNRSYDLQQVFFKEDNLFVIIVNAIKK